MTWREEWAKYLTAQQRSNLRSWGVDCPEPPVLPGAPAAGPMSQARAKETLERLYTQPEGVQGCGCPWERGPRNVHSGNHRDGACQPATIRLDQMYGTTVVIPRG